MEAEPSLSSAPKTVGRYALYEEMASGGMATVHYGRLLGPVGFSRTVAIKRLHPQLAKDPDFASMFLDEARLAARIHHPNVVQTLDVVALENELFLVMEYIQGESLARLIRTSRVTKQPIPLPIVSAIFCGVLQGLHAAHEATSEQGEPLRLVHRDVSPQNVLVGADGVPRVLDFGVAKAVGRLHTTGEGQLKGKLPYMSPEQVSDKAVDRRSDVYAVGVVLWEALALKRLFDAENEAAVLSNVIDMTVKPPSSLAPHVPAELDAICMRALDRDPSKRFEDAWAFAQALEACIAPATTARVSEWVKTLASEVLSKRAQTVARIESSDSGSIPPPPVDGDRVSSPPSRSRAIVHAYPEGEALPSQVSSISVSSAANARAKERPGRLGYVVGAIGAALFVLAAIVFFRGRDGHEQSSAAGSAAQSAEAHPSASSAASVAMPAASVDSTSSAEPPHHDDATHVSRPPKAHPVVARPSASPTSSSNHCDPPYYIDSAGHRQYKPECL